jgi:Protein of unknown function (DUF2911)
MLRGGWSVLFSLILLAIATAIALADSKPDSVITACTFEDGNEISIRYIPVPSDKQKPQNGRPWAPGGLPMMLFTPVDLILDKTQVGAGAKSLYIIPGNNQWSLVVSKNVGEKAQYDEHQNLVRAAMEIGELNAPARELQLTFVHTGSKQCSLRTDYGKTGAWIEFHEK